MNALPEKAMIIERSPGIQRRDMEKTKSAYIISGLCLDDYFFFVGFFFVGLALGLAEVCKDLRVSASRFRLLVRKYILKT